MKAYRIDDRFTFLPLKDDEGDFGLLYDSKYNTLIEIFSQDDLRQWLN
jgi:hypothetical protein